MDPKRAEVTTGCAAFVDAKVYEHKNYCDLLKLIRVYGTVFKTRIILYCCNCITHVTFCVENYLDWDFYVCKKDFWNDTEIYTSFYEQIIE